MPASVARQLTWEDTAAFCVPVPDGPSPAKRPEPAAGRDADPSIKLDSHDPKGPRDQRDEERPETDRPV